MQYRYAIEMSIGNLRKFIVQSKAGADWIGRKR